MKSSLFNLLRLAYKGIRGNRHFSIFFVLNLSVGLCGLLALESLRYSVDDYFKGQAKAILGGDLEVEVDDRSFTEADLKTIQSVMPPNTQKRTEKHFYTMAASAENSRLINVQAVDKTFPFFPSLTLKQRGLIKPGTDTGLITSPHVWIYPELALQLEVDIGDQITIGGKSFEIADLVLNDAALSSAGLMTAPRVFVGIPQIAATGLFDVGSQFEDALYFKFAPGAPPVETVAKQLEQVGAADLDIDPYTESGGRTGRFWNRLGDYLTLIALVALFLAGVGVTYLFRGYLEKSLSEIALLMSLGAAIWQIRIVYTLQLTLLALLATGGATGIALLAQPLFPLIFGDLLPREITVSLFLSSVLLTAIVAVLTSLLVAYPLLKRLGQIKPAALFQESGGFEPLGFNCRTILGWLPAGVFYWLLAVWQADSLRIGSAFLGIFLGGILGLLLIGALLWWLFPKPETLNNQPLRLAALNLFRYRAATLMGFVAIGAGVLLASMIPQVRAVLHQELSADAAADYPSLFMLDIQADQLPAIRRDLAGMGLKFQQTAPLIRARLTAINGTSIEQLIKQTSDTKPGGNDRRRRRLSREYNLTYSDQLKPSEVIVAGTPLSVANPSQAPHGISLEEDFAEDLDLAIGDQLTFTISGIPIAGEIVNLRQIKWSSFQPNFFVKFADGALNDFPKIHVATTPAMSMSQRNQVQNRIVQQYPNVSIVDVSRIIDRVLAVVETITLAMATMAVLTLLAGFAVVMSIASFNASARKPQMALLQVLGSGFRTIRLAIIWEFFLLGTAAGLAGSLLSVAASYAACYVMFDRLWTWSWQWPVAIFVAVPVACIATGLWASRTALKTKPIRLLAAS
jgi:putative ABC transport system permease protein